MLAAIRVEEKALTDPRFSILGKLMGIDKFSARGRVEMLWSHCTEIKSYYLTPTVIDTLAECDGFSEMICHSEVSLAEKTDKGIRIKGTRGRIEWLTTLRKSSAKGGEKTRAKWLAKEGPKARPTPQPTLGVPTPVLVPTPTPVNKNNNTNTLLAKARALTDPRFESFWAKWKKKIKKTEAKKAWLTNSPDDRIDEAVQKYDIFCEKNGIEFKYVMHPSTFLNSWTDWLEFDGSNGPGQLSLGERLKARGINV